MATYQSIRYNVDYGGKAGSLMPLALFTSDGSDANATFTSGIDSTYDEYLFIFNDIHPETTGKHLNFQVDTGSNTSYNQTITSTSFKAYHQEDDTGDALTYNGSYDQAQGTAFQNISTDIINDADASCSGYLHLYNPASTTFVKHFLSVCHGMTDGSPPYAENRWNAGYINTTTAITRVQFKMTSGEIQGGTIGMFGVI